jgi:hypothetical protein
MAMSFEQKLDVWRRLVTPAAEEAPAAQHSLF